MPERVEIKVKGLHCTNCALGVERHLKKNGFHDAAVDFSTGVAAFSLEEQGAIPEIIQGIRDLGFEASIGDEPEQGAVWRRSLEAKFVFCLIFTLPLFAHMFVPWGVLHEPWVQLGFCLPVFLVGLVHFGRSAVSSLRTGVPNMDVLIVIGIAAAFAYSLIGTVLALGMDYLFYETSATITTIVLLGNLLEERSVKKTTSAIEDLTRLQAVRARRIRQEGEREVVVEVDSREVHTGDLLLVNTGDIVPADGEVVSGRAGVDEAVITGESAPVEKEAGSQVVGGTVAVSGSFRMSARAVGEKTVVAEMVRLVKQAQQSPPRIQRIGDRVSAVFVPAVLLVAAAAFGVSYLALGVDFQFSLLRAIAVLVIACPCAMGLATPTAVMVGIGKAARRGILIKGGATLERLAQVHTVIFDKTGTITTGRFHVRVMSEAGQSEARVKSLAAALERHSSHPLARSILEAFSDVEPARLLDIREEKGRGVSGRGAGGEEYEIRGVRDTDRRVEGEDLCLTENGAPIAWLAVQDEVKTEARAVVSALKERGLKVVMLSGDRRGKCAAAAGEAGIEVWHAEKSPAEKLEVIRALESAGPCAFVGDGINDAPSLAAAGVGVSLSEATRIAMQSAQVVLLGGDLRHLVSALNAAGLTLRTIKQNLFWAFFYNVLAIPAAAAGYLNPMVAAVAMAFSDVVVIGNSLRMRRKRI